MSNQFIVPSGTKFKDIHLELNEKLKEIFPERYGDGTLVKGAKYIETINADWDMFKMDNYYTDDKGLKEDVTNSVQKVRAAKNKKIAEVKEDIKKNGYDLREPRPAFYRDKQGRLMPADGRGKWGSMKELGYKNIQVDIFEVANQSVARHLGNRLNWKTKPKADIEADDIEKQLVDDINENILILSGKEHKDFALLVDEAQASGGDSFKESTYNKIARRVLSKVNKGAYETRISYDDKTAKLWMEKYKYVDDYRPDGHKQGNGIFYYVCSANTLSKSYKDAVYKADFLATHIPHFKQLRVVLHPGEISSSDVAESFRLIIDNGRTEWENYTKKLKTRVTGEDLKIVNKKQLVLYGCLPASGAMQEDYPLNKMILFDKGPLANGKTFTDLYNDETLSKQFISDED